MAGNGPYDDLAEVVGHKIRGFTKRTESREGVYLLKKGRPILTANQDALFRHSLPARRSIMLLYYWGCLKNSFKFYTCFASLVGVERAGFRSVALAI